MMEIRKNAHTNSLSASDDGRSAGDSVDGSILDPTTVEPTGMAMD